MKRIVLIIAALLIATPALAAPKKRTDLSAQKRGPISTAIEKAKQDIQTKREDAAESQAPAEDASRQRLLQQLARPFQKLADFIGADAENAIALSTAVPGIQDGHGQQCWIAARNFTAVFQAHPLPLTGGAMTDLEALRLLAISSKQLCENSHCTQVFTDFKNMAITVAQTGFGAIGAAAVRGAPSLQDVCTQVPNIPMADPVSPVPAAPAVKPVLGPGSTPTPQ